MRLIRQTTLYFQEGNSDKVYEVDLCEAGEGEYIVNFRYGRRGARLREGTKTSFPEPLDKAEKVFDRLVQSKLNKGYRETLQEATDEVAEPVADDSVQDIAVGRRGGTPIQRKKVAALKINLVLIISR